MVGKGVRLERLSLGVDRALGLHSVVGKFLVRLVFLLVCEDTYYREVKFKE